MAAHEVTGAGGHFIRAVELARKAHDRHVEAWTLDYLGNQRLAGGSPSNRAPVTTFLYGFKGAPRRAGPFRPLARPCASAMR